MNLKDVISEGKKEIGKKDIHELAINKVMMRQLDTMPEQYIDLNKVELEYMEMLYKGCVKRLEFLGEDTAPIDFYNILTMPNVDSGYQRWSLTQFINTYLRSKFLTNLTKRKVFEFNASITKKFIADEIMEQYPNTQFMKKLTAVYVEQDRPEKIYEIGKLFIELQKDGDEHPIFYSRCWNYIEMAILTTFYERRRIKGIRKFIECTEKIDSVLTGKKYNPMNVDSIIRTIKSDLKNEEGHKQFMDFSNEYFKFSIAIAEEFISK